MPKKKKKNPPKHWERERENLFLRENYVKNGKEWQIYSKMEEIRRDK